jgi:hypothetical protein
MALKSSGVVQRQRATGRTEGTLPKRTLYMVSSTDSKMGGWSCRVSAGAIVRPMTARFAVAGVRGSMGGGLALSLWQNEGTVGDAGIDQQTRQFIDTRGLLRDRYRLGYAYAISRAPAANLYYLYIYTYL